VITIYNFPANCLAKIKFIGDHQQACIISWLLENYIFLGLNNNDFTKRGADFFML